MSYKLTRWSDEDLAALRKFYPEGGYKLVQENLKFPRGKSAITRKAFYFGLEAPKAKPDLLARRERERETERARRAKARLREQEVRKALGVEAGRPLSIWEVEEHPQMQHAKYCREILRAWG